MITAEQATDLAVAYHAFHDESNKGDSKKIALWARMLLNTQRETGVKMISESILEFWIKDAEGVQNMPFIILCVSCFAVAYGIAWFLTDGFNNL